ncbi:Hypothetical_protein [Hexamita inflata]|uniref:Hypothetical_protein n=1 Tax=Hexamita inflata TaxID=28002 RepID=A0AA86NP67_9EUKA|nr:Hypothetical protein HINF_LOCUS10121 [Hexamita inflata]CAI9947585.1 Hypothetical protein HINF_LOCUS35230 [Hexamita inflata]CAI9947587.1 Hypothetical protein HINF_LOCUS35232 [Hexamita inflata]
MECQLYRINSFNIRITTSKLFQILGASAKRHAMSQQYKYVQLSLDVGVSRFSRQWWDDRTESNLGGKGGSGQMSNQINYHGIAAVSYKTLCRMCFSYYKQYCQEYAFVF